jgi:hypothetical protein
VSELLSRRRLGRATLARQMLLAREHVSATEAVERLAGMQAQEPRPPFVGLWSRVEGFRREQLVEAVQSREVVRTTLMRATLHLTSSAHYGVARAALQPALAAAMSARGDLARGLEPDAVLRAARTLLRDGALDFNEIRAGLAQEFPEVNHRALGYWVRTNLPLAMEPSDDRWGFPRAARFGLADRWLDASPTAPAAEELVLRYLAAFGPASAADFQTWSGLRGMKVVFERLRERLVAFTDESGRELLDLADAPRPDEDVPAPARFLPDFDNLVLAHADRTRVVADEHRRGLVTKNLRVRATFLVDGVVAGTWSIARKGKKATLTVAPFSPLRKRDAKELAAEGEALTRFAEEDAASFEVTGI